MAIVDVSLPAVCLYEPSDYKMVGHGIYELGNGVGLLCEIIKKKQKVNEI